MSVSEAEAVAAHQSAPWDAASPPAIPAAQWEVIQFCVQGVKMLGVSRSIGEIFGFVFTSAKPVTFEEIVSSLGISAGSASHGLRYLRRIGALDVIYLARDRRDHYVAEQSFRRLCSGFLLENFAHQLSNERERLRLMHQRLIEETDARCHHLPGRIEILLSWLTQANTALSAAAETLHATAENGPKH